MFLELSTSEWKKEKDSMMMVMNVFEKKEIKVVKDPVEKRKERKKEKKKEKRKK